MLLNSRNFGPSYCGAAALMMSPWRVTGETHDLNWLDN